MIPNVGDEFVEMEASAGQWAEITQQIADVVGPVGGHDGQWLIEWGQASLTNVPRVFTDAYGADFGKPRLRRTIIEFRDGRWRRLRERAELRAAPHRTGA